MVQIRCQATGRLVNGTTERISGTGQESRHAVAEAIRRASSFEIEWPCSVRPEAGHRRQQMEAQEGPDRDMPPS